MKLLSKLKEWKDKKFGKNSDVDKTESKSVYGDYVEESIEVNKRVKQKDGSEKVINRVGRNDLCLCGSGLKFKHCECSKVSK